MSILISFIPAWLFELILIAGIFGTTLIILFNPLIPLQYKLPIQVGSAIAMVISSFFIGMISSDDRWQLEVIKQQAEIQRLETESQKVTTKIVTEYVDRKIYIKDKGHEIIKKVPIYVTKKADDNCTIPNGVIQLLNASIKNEIPDSTRITDAGITKNGNDLQ